MGFEDDIEQISQEREREMALTDRGCHDKDDSGILWRDGSSCNMVSKLLENFRIRIALRLFVIVKLLVVDQN